MNKLFISMLLAILLICSPFAIAESEKSKPAKIAVTQLEKFNLAEQISGLKGYDIRARKIIVPAGVTIGEHAHDTRPGIVYVESGEIIEYRGKISRLLKPGDSLIEDATTVHSYKNTSDEVCVLIAFDIPVVNKQ